jgi:dGTPase
MNVPFLDDPNWVAPEVLSARELAWAATMRGHALADRATNSLGDTPGIRRAHENSSARVETRSALLREEREALEAVHFADGATRSNGSGERSMEEAPDPVRTCFERDRDRILHGNAFRRLAGKTQVFIFPGDHQRSRLTHALEVAQVARSIAQACRLNVALAEAIALGHDCGHGPGGHASEDALSPYVVGGYDHAVWGADVVLAPLNLCAQTIDGIRNHSWSRPAPSTPEGEVVSWADRIAYVCHDFEDAVHAGLAKPTDLPMQVQRVCGTSRSSQLNAFIVGIVESVATQGVIGMTMERADALAEFRRWNYEHIYLRPESRREAAAVTSVLRALVEHYAAKPELLPEGWKPGSYVHRQTRVAASEEALHAAVTYVGGMTDRFACDRAVVELNWDPGALPRGVGVGALR